MKEVLAPMAKKQRPQHCWSCLVTRTGAARYGLKYSETTAATLRGS
jgi:hypothetical protein